MRLHCFDIGRIQNLSFSTELSVRQGQNTDNSIGPSNPIPTQMGVDLFWSVLPLLAVANIDYIQPQ